MTKTDILRVVVSSATTFAITAGTAYGAVSAGDGIPTKASIITLLVGAVVATARHVQTILTEPPKA